MKITEQKKTYNVTLTKRTTSGYSRIKKRCFVCFFLYKRKSKAGKKKFFFLFTLFIYLFLQCQIGQRWVCMCSVRVLIEGQRVRKKKNEKLKNKQANKCVIEKRDF